jgi:ORF6N domain
MAEGSDEQGLELIPLAAIQKRILVVRERHVMLDEDLADLYGVETRRLIEQVKGKHDEQLLEIFKALRQLISPPPRPKRRVGFGLPEEDQQ